LQDNAYAWGTELLSADSEGRLRYRINADYGKLFPISRMDSEGNPSDNTVLLFNALDRADKTNSSEPQWINDGGISDPEYGANQILLPISYDNFLLLSKVKQGTQTLSLRELFTAEKAFDNYGYLKESFRAEIFSRLGNTMFFLPMAVLALVLGWRYRARKKPRYVYVPMLILLPMVFYGAVTFYRDIINNLSVWLSLSMGLATALIYLCVGGFALFIVTLILLAAQHG
jgi:lipopolysaccharide export LptBFGC system permease protein LptF